MSSWELGHVWETKLENSRTDARGSISYLNQNPPPLPPKELFFNFFKKIKFIICFSFFNA